jgi:hypothetical protein
MLILASMPQDLGSGRLPNQQLRMAQSDGKSRQPAKGMADQVDWSPRARNVGVAGQPSNVPDCGN